MKASNEKLADEELISKANEKLRQQNNERVLLNKITQIMGNSDLKSTNSINDNIKELENVLTEVSKTKDHCIPVFII